MAWPPSDLNPISTRGGAARQLERKFSCGVARGLLYDLEFLYTRCATR